MSEFSAAERASAALAKANTALADFAEMVGQVDSPDDLASFLLALASLRELVSGERGKDNGLYRRVEKQLLPLMGSKVLKTPAGPFEAMKQTRRVGWRWNELIPVVVARALDERQLDEATGEFEREGDAVARVLRDCIGMSYGKVQALRARGIRPGDFCIEEDNGYQIRLPMKDREEAA